MERNNQYPIILGMTPPNKQGIGIKSKLGSGYDLYILDEDMIHQYAQLHFCNKEAIDRMESSDHERILQKDVSTEKN